MAMSVEETTTSRNPSPERSSCLLRSACGRVIRRSPGSFISILLTDPPYEPIRGQVQAEGNAEEQQSDEEETLEGKP